MMTCRKLRAEIANLKEAGDLQMEIFRRMVDRDKEREDEHVGLIASRAAAWAHAREIADKLNDVEAYVGPLHSSANSAYRKVAREITAIIQAPPAEPDHVQVNSGQNVVIKNTRFVA
jgi:hypothetical protein